MYTAEEELGMLQSLVGWIDNANHLLSPEEYVREVPVAVENTLRKIGKGKLVEDEWTYA